MNLNPLIEALIDVLQQEQKLLAELTDEVFGQPGTGAFESSIGTHLRHNLDHFSSFFAGLRAGQIDYEQRRRDDRIAHSVDHARAEVARQLVALQTLREQPDQPIRVRAELDDGDEEARVWLDSSLGRELQFLLGHTVHHHAIMAILLSHQGIDLPAGFGVAPSTQRHERQQTSPSGGREI